jgi:hypothetical protein
MSPLDSIERLCGAHIDAITVEEHVAGSERSLISIFLQLGGESGVRIRGAPSGWGLAVGSDAPKAYDLEQYGRVEIGPADAFLGRAGGKVVKVWTVHAPDDATPVGIRWSTSARADVVVYAYDDVLLVAPPDQLELDGVSFTALC